jgi:hypothetical protein
MYSAWFPSTSNIPCCSVMSRTLVQGGGAGAAAGILPILFQAAAGIAVAGFSAATVQRRRLGFRDGRLTTTAATLRATLASAIHVQLVHVRSPGVM